MTILKNAAFIGLAWIMGAQGAFAIVVNGSFESPVVPVGSGTLFLTGSSFDSGEWTVVGLSGASVAVVSGALTDGAFSFPAHDGAQWMDLSGISNTYNEGIVQTIPTTPGVVYDLGFFIGNLSGETDNFQSTVSVSVNGGGGTYTNSIAGTTLTWQEFHHGFLATGASTSIAFFNGDPFNDGSNALDSVTVSAVPVRPHLINGSFESPVVPNGAGALFPTGSSFHSGEWTVLGTPVADVAIVSGGYTDGSFTFPAHSGNQWLDLSGTFNTLNEGIVQMIATTPGEEYDVGFFIGNLSGGTYNIDSTVKISIDGGPATSYTNSIPGTTLTWQEFHHGFVATGSSTSIAFLNGDPFNDGSNALDSVTVSVAGAGLPGNYNGDDFVDAADYVVWRKDPTAVLPADYSTWRTNFGNTPGSERGGSLDSNSPVPEPSAFGIVGMGAIALLCRRRVPRSLAM